MLTNEIVFLFVKRYIRDVKKQSQSLSAPQPTVPALEVCGVASSSSGDSDRETMLHEFRRLTGMNNAYARQCLNEFNWDFHNALSSFKVINNTGGIPQIAFVPD